MMMSRLKADPDAIVGSLAELFAIASALAAAAASHYASISVRLRAAGPGPVACVFDRLSADKASYADRVMHRARHRAGPRPDHPTILQALPDVFDDEGAISSAPGLLTPYRAFAMATRNDDRTFSFWSYVAAHAEASEVQSEAETLAHEALEQAAIVRRERRHAFHAQRAADPADGSGSEPVAQFEALEVRLADMLEHRAMEAAADEQGRLLEEAVRGRRNALLLGSLPAFSSRSPALDQVPDEPLALAEFLAERYLEAADALVDEHGIATAQTLAAAAISRLARLKRNAFRQAGPSGTMPLTR